MVALAPEPHGPHAAPRPSQVYVTNPDESPAPRVTVKAEGFQGLVATQRDGTAKLVLNMPANKDSVPITVSRERALEPGWPRCRGAGVVEVTWRLGWLRQLKWLRCPGCPRTTARMVTTDRGPREHDQGTRMA